MTSQRDRLHYAAEQFDDRFTDAQVSMYESTMTGLFTVSVTYDDKRWLVSEQDDIIERFDQMERKLMVMEL